MIFEASYGHQITDRYLDVLKLKQKGKVKAVRSMEADSAPEGTVEKVNLMLIHVRTSINKNIKARGILKNSKDYLMLKEIAKMAYDFADHFDIRPKDDGIKEYLTMGIGFMGKYGLNKFKTYNNRIYESFESKVEVLTDEYKENTQLFYMKWQEKMLEYIGPEELTNLDKDYVKFVHMVYGRLAADNSDADYGEWIAAQFDGLAFVNAIPEINQFYGENAKLRYERFLTRSIDAKPEEDSSEPDLLTMYQNNRDYDDE